MEDWRTGRGFKLFRTSVACGTNPTAAPLGLLPAVKSSVDLNGEQGCQCCVLGCP